MCYRTLFLYQSTLGNMHIFIHSIDENWGHRHPNGQWHFCSLRTAFLPAWLHVLWLCNSHLFPLFRSSTHRPQRSPGSWHRECLCQPSTVFCLTHILQKVHKKWIKNDMQFYPPQLKVNSFRAQSKYSQQKPKIINRAVFLKKHLIHSTFCCCHCP